jgi:hypothetical protein
MESTKRKRQLNRLFRRVILYSYRFGTVHTFAAVTSSLIIIIIVGFAYPV